jgi:hypothetical protein
LAGAQIAAACEAMALGVRAGADAATPYEVIANSAGNSQMFTNRVPHILARDFIPLPVAQPIDTVRDRRQRRPGRQRSAHREVGCPLPPAAPPRPR